jgi:signal transduction histidine kinase
MQTHDHTGGSGFLPHGFCYLWDPQLLWTHVISDFMIGTAYVTISLSLAWLVHRVRRDIPFSWAFVAFGLFIITCGITHYIEIWTMWQPVYWLSGGVKVVTAVASVATAIAMPFTVPRTVATVRDARLSRERELAAARASALQEQNDVLRRQAEALERQRSEAQALAAELESANGALRSALSDAQDARIAAERASQAKTVFLRTMSHELRTPLNAVIGYAQLLEVGAAGAISDAQRQYLQRIDRSAAHLLALIDEVLTLAREPDEGRGRMFDDVSLREAVDEVAMMIAPQASERGLDLEVGDIPDVMLRTDGQWLKQVLLNLSSNAVKFTAQGRVAIRADVTAEAVAVHVRDTGPGIAPEHREQVFQPFWQVDQGTTRRYGGTGLGLSVSRELARRLGGEITLDSEPGAGSRFTLHLPR